MPPLATTGASVRAQTCRSRSRFGPAQHAVGGDVGDDEAGAAGAVEPVEGLVELAALRRPAAGGEPGAADVEADGDPVAVGGDDLLAPLRALEGGGADVDPAAAGGQRPLEGLVVADAAGQLHLHAQVGDDLGDDLGVAALAEGGVEVDQVDPLRAGVLPALGGGPRVPEHLLRAEPTLDQLDRLAAGDVDGGQQDQRAVRRIHPMTLPERPPPDRPRPPAPGGLRPSGRAQQATAARPKRSPGRGAHLAEEAARSSRVARSVYQRSSMSQTSSSAGVSASTSGRVCTTVEGKLMSRRASTPSRAAISSGRSGRTTSTPRPLDPGELGVGLLAVGEVAVDGVLLDEAGDAAEVGVGVHDAGLHQRGADEVGAQLDLRHREAGPHPAEGVAAHRRPGAARRPGW